MKKIGLSFIGIFIVIQSFAQIDFALTGLYNFQTNGIGADARILIPVHRTLFVIPRAAYFPSFNKTHESYAGIELSKFLFNVGGMNPYIFAGGYYNHWINYKSTNSSKATEHNFTLEPGVGVLFYKGWFNPFIEGRYSAKWNEYTIGVGILFHLNDCLGRSKNQSPWMCPSF